MEALKAVVEMFDKGYKVDPENHYEFTDEFEKRFREYLYQKGDREWPGFDYDSVLDGLGTFGLVAIANLLSEVATSCKATAVSKFEGVEQKITALEGDIQQLRLLLNYRVDEVTKVIRED